MESAAESSEQLVKINTNSSNPMRSPSIKSKGTLSPNDVFSRSAVTSKKMRKRNREEFEMADFIPQKSTRKRIIDPNDNQFEVKLAENVSKATIDIEEEKEEMKERASKAKDSVPKRTKMIMRTR